MAARTRRRVAGGPSARAIGVDTGGTFTDVVALVDGRTVAMKVLSTPAAPQRAVLEGLRRAGANARTQVRHGSTVATNTLLERKGARVTLVTTEGFEDLLEIGRQDRVDIYALRTHRVEPLVDTAHRIGIAERMDVTGAPLTKLSREAVRTAVAVVKRKRPQAVAVGLLHAYANPAHERRVVRALRGEGFTVCGSFEISPEVREFERFTTTVVNAYLLPRVERYVAALEKGTPATVEVVLSHGGTAPPKDAAREPVRQLLSGPAAGVKAAASVAAACGFERALTLDVGGTSTDCAFIDGEPPRRRGREVAGFPIQLPMLDVHTVGAGGGSIARLDAGGLLHVGPESAGASPGPACYGRGGPATVTDAFIVLGRIPGETLAGGALKLDRAASEAALRELGRKLGEKDPRIVARGVLTVANAHMEAALRNVSIERGHDPRAAALVAFGGAGGLHACELAEALDVATVLAPRHAGVLSAVGALLGGARRERSRSVMLDSGHTDVLESTWSELERDVLRAFPAAERERVRLERWAEVRYAGQAHELSVPVKGDFVARFHRMHRDRFGFSRSDAAVEVVTVEVRGATPGERVPPVAAARDGAEAGKTRAWTRGAMRSVPMWPWNAIGPRTKVAGPAIVVEDGATLWMPRGWRGRLHASGTLVVERRSA